MPENPTVRQTLQEVLHLHRNRTAFIARIGPEAVDELIRLYSAEIANLWRITAELRCLEAPNRHTHPHAPGYIHLAVGETALQVPFHLVPGLPDSEVLGELAALSQDIRTGDPDGIICLSGSTLLMRDFARIGDIDFCEYVPAHRHRNAMFEAFRRILAKSSGSRFAISVRSRNSPADSFEDFDVVNRGGRLDDEQMLSIAATMEEACNGKATFLANTRFAGMIEVSNWIVFHSRDPDDDPLAFQLSFAFQEAAIGLRSRRSLHLFDSLVAYLVFLFGEIGKYRDSDPVKAVKRAVPLLRLFGEGALADRLLRTARAHRAFACAAALARAEVHARYRPLGLPPELLAALEYDARQLAEEALGLGEGQPVPENATAVLAAALDLFKEAAGEIWPEILALADPSPAG